MCKCSHKRLVIRSSSICTLLTKLKQWSGFNSSYLTYSNYRKSVRLSKLSFRNALQISITFTDFNNVREKLATFSATIISMVKDENHRPKIDLRCGRLFQPGVHLIKAYKNLPTLCFQIYHRVWQHIDVWATVLENVLCKKKCRSRLTYHHLSDIFLCNYFPIWAKLWQHHKKHAMPSFPLSSSLGSIKLAPVTC